MRSSGLRSSHFYGALVLLLACGVCAMFGAAAGKRQATVVAVVNVEEVKANCDLWTDLNGQQNDRFSDYGKTINTLRKEIDDLRTQLNASDGSEDASLGAELVRKNALLQEWLQHGDIRVDGDNAINQEALFRAIKAEAELMAQTDGIDLILFHIPSSELPTYKDDASKELQARVYYSGTHRALYVAPELDITKDLINRLNIKFRAGQ